MTSWLIFLLAGWPVVTIGILKLLGVSLELGLPAGLLGLANISLAFVAWHQMWSLKKRLVKEAEEKVWDEALLSSLGEGIVVTDKDGKIVLINKKAEELVGWKQTEVVGKRWHEVAPLVDEKGVAIPPERRATQKVLAGGAPVANATFYYVRRDGTKFSVGTTAAPVILNGKTIGVIAVFRDITHERDVDRAKSEFVSLASHQLRTPLSAIKWFCEMLLAGDAGKLNLEQMEYLDNVNQSNDRMIDLVDSLLNISRIESGRIIIDPKPTDLGKLLKSLTEELRGKIEERKLKLAVSVHEGLPLVNLDPKLVEQVYMNLLTNSIKYTPAGGQITVMVSKKDDQLLSQISDNGYGIPKEEQKRLFEKFYRGTNIQKVETDGTGLGLYLVKAIIDSSGGKIWYESEVGVGTTFWFSLPLSGMKPKAGEVTLNS